MRKNVLALSIATMIGGLGFAGVASASVIQGTGTPTASTLGATTADTFRLSTGGTGHQLILPYFNSQNGNGTVFHVVNTDTVNGKAVKVRFRGASNSDDILDFYVLLSPSDTWTGVVTAGSNGFSTISSADNSCTYPKISSSGQPFVPNRLNQAWTPSVQANNTREGYVELFVAADIPSQAAYNSANTNTAPTTSRSNLYTAIKHVNGVAPCTLAALDGALLTEKTTELEAAGFGFATPTGGVAGSWYIINVPQTTTFSGDLTALQAVNAGVISRANYVVFPQVADPVATAEIYTADPLLSGAGLSNRTKSATNVVADNVANAIIPAAQYDLPDLSTPYLNVPATAANARLSAANLTAQLAASSITNQYATDASISAKTDWVFSMPTRRYSVAYDYSATGTTKKTVYSSVPAGVGAPQYFHDSNVVVDAAAAQLCVNLSGGAQSFFDREETGNTTGAVFSPGSISNTRFCGETSVLSFGDAGNSALSASVARQTVTNGLFTNGFSVLATTSASGLGLPILGSAFIKLTNPAASTGVSGNYGITWSHISK